jgi:hypothetical protein|tara:strand:- start:810 stop:1028 length:219 start_codon:yes stop_codon:yes gene_type:complete
MTEINIKFIKAIKILKADAELSWSGVIQTENDFNNNIQWVTGTNENGTAITTDTCPHSEITWTLLKAEMDKL